jgi:hypothetical protein
VWLLGLDPTPINCSPKAGLLLLRRIIRPRDAYLLPNNHLASSDLKALMSRVCPKGGIFRTVSR